MWYYFMQANKFPVTVHMIYIYIKTGLFSRSKNLASPDVTAKLHVRNVRYT